jgi:hypothetical protein
MPFSIIEVNNADELRKYLLESETVQYNPAIYDSSRAENDMAAMFGLPQVVTGRDSGEDLASALALAKEGMETGVARRRIQANRVLTEMYIYVAQISIKVFSEDVIARRCGALAVWPRLTCEQMMSEITIEIKGGYSGKPRAKDTLDLWTNFAQIAAQLNLPVNGAPVLQELLESLSIRKDYKRFLVPVPPLGMVPNAPQNQAPAPSRGQGPDGGAPLMVDPQRGAPQSLDQVPGPKLPI